MRVLVVSHEPWNSHNNGGNVLSNIFEGFEGEFRQIYCSAGLPNNNICKEYYQLTDKMIIDNVLKRKETGKTFNIDDLPKTNNDEQFEKNSKKRRWQLIFLAREIIWQLAKIDNEKFISFIKDYNPDVIFAPCYGNPRMLRLTRTIAKYTDAPIISYVSDDLYSYRVINYNPLFWIRRWNLRRNVRKTFKYYKLVYTMTKEQLDEYFNIFKVPMKILMKSCNVPTKHTFKKPYKLIYAGNLYLGREDILINIANVIKRLNKYNINFVLNIFSGSTIPQEKYDILNDGVNTIFNGLISADKLIEEYKNSDIALHVESFSKENALNTRLSFSTKITDCLESGCATMAICPSINAGFKYLQDENCAICISNVEDIEKTFSEILENPLILEEYANKAKAVIIKNHDKNTNLTMIQNDFKEVLNKK